MTPQVMHNRADRKLSSSMVLATLTLFSSQLASAQFPKENDQSSGGSNLHASKPYATSVSANVQDCEFSLTRLQGKRKLSRYAFLSMQRHNTKPMSLCGPSQGNLLSPDQY
jgi:hypothetical protein